MKIYNKLTLILCVLALSLTTFTYVYADYCEFSIEGPENCGIDSEFEITVTLASDMQLNDSDAYLVYDTECLELIECESDEYDTDEGKIRLRGDFSEDKYSCSWDITFNALEAGETDFSITDRWVQTVGGDVTNTTVADYEIEISEDSDISSDESKDNPDETEDNSFNVEDSDNDSKSDETNNEIETAEDEKLTGLESARIIVIVIIVVLVIAIILVNVIFNKLEAKLKRKRIHERQRLSREELNQKREIERKIREKRISETESQNIQRPKK